MVINTADQIASLASLIPFTEKMTTKTQIIQYPGEVGVCLQHLGILVGRQAQATIWPDILSWIKRQNDKPLPDPSTLDANQIPLSEE
jgi:polyhydroxyalkanoate synthase